MHHRYAKQTSALYEKWLTLFDHMSSLSAQLTEPTLTSVDDTAQQSRCAKQIKMKYSSYETEKLTHYEFDPIRLKKFACVIKSGALYNQESDSPLTNGTYLYVLSTNNVLYVAPPAISMPVSNDFLATIPEIDQPMAFEIKNHSHFALGGNVLGAGMLKIVGFGQLKYFNNASGHYKPCLEEMDSTFNFFYPLSRGSFFISYGHLAIDEEKQRLVYRVYDFKKMMNAQQNYRRVLYFQGVDLSLLTPLKEKYLTKSPSSQSLINEHGLTEKGVFSEKRQQPLLVDNKNYIIDSKPSSLESNEVNAVSSRSSEAETVELVSSISVNKQRFFGEPAWKGMPYTDHTIRLLKYHGQRGEGKLAISEDVFPRSIVRNC